MKKSYEYLDYRKLLSDWYHHRKSQGGFSYQAWADQAGFGAKDFLYRVLQGQRNLSPEGAIKVAQSMEFNAAETEYFLELVQFNQASERNTRDAHWNKIKEILKLRQYTNDSVRRNYQSYRLLSEWYHKAIQAIILRQGYNGDAAALGAMLHPPISESQARKSVELLTELGLIDLDSKPENSDQDKDSPCEKIQRQALQEYYRSCYEMALAAIDEFDAHEREVSSMVLNLNATSYAKILAKAEAFKREILELAKEGNEDKSYMLNLNLFPVSKS